MSTKKPYRSAPRSMIRKARKLGRQTGEGAADVQYMPGGGRDTAPDAAGRALAILKAYDDCDGSGPADAILNTPDWLSGEWAGEPTAGAIAELCGLDLSRDPEGTIESELATAYCDAADSAYQTFIIRHLRNVTKGDS